MNGIEAALLRALYGLPGVTTTPLRIAMQAGTRGAVLVVAAALVLAGRRRSALAVSAGGFGAWAVASALKEVVERPRPTAAVLSGPLRETVAGFAFPSTHAAVAAAMAVTLVVALRPPWATALLLAAVAGATALARVHLGVHWPTDVLAGGCIGAVCGLAGGAWAGRRPGTGASAPVPESG